MHRIPLLSLVAILLLGANASAQTIENGSIKLRLTGRVQAQFSTTSVSEEELLAAGQSVSPIPSSMFETRRIRFGAVAEFDDWLTGKLEAELGMARLQIRDAYLNMGFTPALQLRVGQFKKPFSLLQLHSSSMWPVIERGVRIRGLAPALAFRDSSALGNPVLQNFDGDLLIGEEQTLLDAFLYSNFDIGATLLGTIGDFSYTIGAFNGAGGDQPDDTDAKSYAGRLTYTLATDRKVTIGGAVSHREFRLSTSPAIETRSGTAYSADLEIGEFRKPGVRFIGEVVLGDNLQDPDNDFLAAQAVVAYFIPLEHKRAQGVELAGRVSYGDPRRDVDLDEGLLLTPGINLYFFGRNRLMLNWDFFLTDDRFDNENALRAQAQFYF